MAELARWQWDDIGVWRDFAEQYQSEMEACYQRRELTVELAIPPFGTFRMDLNNMKQITLRGRNPGYERDIRRQARKIEVGYFILGCEGEIFASDSAVDQIEEEEVLEMMEKVLGRIVSEPEDFEARSVSLVEEPYRGTLGACESAVEFLNERGFELIEEGNARFLVFMMDDVGGLGEAQKEVQARRERVQKRKPARSDAVAPDDGKPAACEASEIARGNDVSAAESNDVAEAAMEVTVVPAQEAPANPEREATVPRQAKGKGKGKTKGKARTKGKGKGRKGVWRVKKPQPTEIESDFAPEMSHISSYVEQTPTANPSEPSFCVAISVVLALPSGNKEAIVLQEETLDELLGIAKASSGLRLPIVRSAMGGKPLGLACEPGLSLPLVAGLNHGDTVIVEDFEPRFAERLQSGLLRLEDLASVGPLLDWEKPELLKLFLGRMRSLLEGSAEAWCQAAGCSVEDELAYGRALLTRLYGERPLEARLEACRQMLPVEKKDQKTVLRINRGTFTTSAVTGLQKLTLQDLRKYVTIEFVGEVAEDHGGPRRDFFGGLGARLANELPVLWRRLGKGSLVPVADLVAESSPKDALGGAEDANGVYQACGRACGLAAKTGDVIGEEFATFFLHQVARDDTVDLKELQQQLAETDGEEDVRASGAILRRSLTDMGLKGQTLTRSITNTNMEVELVPGGKDLEVTEDNKAEWLQLHLHNKLYGSLRQAADAFRQGVLDVFGGSRRTCPLLMLLTPAELAQLWAGSPVGDEGVKLWREAAAVSEEVRQQAEWLWEVLADGDEDLRGRVLKFSTGSHRLGTAGLQAFQVQPADGGDEALPRAMTCANMLQLPRYSSKDALDKQLRKAIEFCDGFQIL